MRICNLTACTLTLRGYTPLTPQLRGRERQGNVSKNQILGVAADLREIVGAKGRSKKGIEAAIRRLESIAEDAPLSRDDLSRRARDIAEDAIGSMDPNDDDARETLIESLDQSVDGMDWVIYTYRAQQIVAASNHDGAIEDCDPSLAFANGSINWSAIAYFAMRAEVDDAIDQGDCEECCREWAWLADDDDHRCPTCKAAPADDGEGGDHE